MALLKERHVYHIRRKNKRQYIRLFFIIIIGLIIIFSAFLIINNIIKAGKNNKEQEISILDLWNSKNYAEIIVQCDKYLKDNPLDSYLLAYLGFSCFYKADSEIEEKNHYYEKAIIALRKALINKEIPFLKEIYYILGLAYFYKDKYYFDLAVKYMENAVSLGLDSTDIIVRLGIAYGKLGNTAKELDYLMQIMSENSPDWLFLLIGKAYFNNNQFDKAEDYFIRYINRTDDPEPEQEARFRLGEIYTKNQDYLKAKEQYIEILKLNSKSVEAHFNLGEIYFKLNENVKARAEWRETLRIDPSHYFARLRYYK